MKYLLAVLVAAVPALADIDWEAEIKKVREEMGDGYRVEHVGLFVVATDADERTYERAKGSLTRCSKALLATYFDTAPSCALACYLFGGKDSYGAYVQKRFGHEPETPYGFYSRAGDCLVMDISTGTGTLVHEMVHAFANADFPSIPAWFNEGLGSLHEQCTQRADGVLEGLTNWRLPILKEGLEEEEVRSWEELTNLSDHDFYTDDKGLNYATARYLCMWLQQQGLLATFYERFRDGAKDDPHGWETLKAVLGRPVEECEGEWREWAAKLEWKD